jgi:hypothetical protein
MLIEKLDVAVIDSSGDVLADLVGGPPLDHIETRPSVFGFGARRSADEEVEFEFTLQIVFFNMVCEGGGDFSGEKGS